MSKYERKIRASDAGVPDAKFFVLNMNIFAF